MQVYVNTAPINLEEMVDDIFKLGLSSFLEQAVQDRVAQKISAQFAYSKDALPNKSPRKSGNPGSNTSATPPGPSPTVPAAPLAPTPITAVPITQPV